MRPEKDADILEQKAFAHVATIGPHGEPQNTPVWFDWDGERFLFSQTHDKQKMKNIERDPRVAISIQDPDDPYRRIEIRGRVAKVEPDPDRRFINALNKTYTGEDEYTHDPPGTERLIVQVEPEHFTTYGD
jgi:PPOX class probable F420-dependent enzyme